MLLESVVCNTFQDIASHVSMVEPVMPHQKGQIPSGLGMNIPSGKVDGGSFRTEPVVKQDDMNGNEFCPASAGSASYLPSPLPGSKPSTHKTFLVPLGWVGMQTWRGKAPCCLCKWQECFKSLTIIIPVSHTCKSGKSLSALT